MLMNDPCQQNKVEHTHPAGLLHAFPMPEQKWESISMDFITGFPKLFGKDCIFVVVDRLIEFAHLFFVTMTFTAAQVDELFLKKFSDCMGFLRALSVAEMKYF